MAVALDVPVLTPSTETGAAGSVSSGRALTGPSSAPGGAAVLWVRQVWVGGEESCVLSALGERWLF